MSPLRIIVDDELNHSLNLSDAPVRSGDTRGGERKRGGREREGREGEREGASNLSWQRYLALNTVNMVQTILFTSLILMSAKTIHTCTWPNE